MKKASLQTLVAGALLCLAGSASATLTFDLEDEFSGGADPLGAGTSLRAEFMTVAGGVRLQLTSLLQDPNEFVGEWDFNLDPALDPTQLTFTFLGASGSFALPTISTGVDAFQADGDGRYDIEFLFDTAPPADRFGGADSVTYLISGIAGLDENDFDFLSLPAGGHGPFKTAAHIQGIAASPGSGWISGEGGGPIIRVPEPASLALLGLGLAALGLMGRRRI